MTPTTLALPVEVLLQGLALDGTQLGAVPRRVMSKVQEREEAGEKESVEIVLEYPFSTVDLRVFFLGTTDRISLTAMATGCAPCICVASPAAETHPPHLY